LRIAAFILSSFLGKNGKENPDRRSTDIIFAIRERRSSMIVRPWSDRVVA
jgi:hypothetical protein